jgi:hypothetical protein
MKLDICIVIGRCASLSSPFLFSTTMSDSTATPQRGIYLFHQGTNNDGTLWYDISPDGQAWQGDKQVPNVGMSSGPGVVHFNYQLYVFYQVGTNYGTA